MSLNAGIFSLTYNLSAPQKSGLEDCQDRRYWPIYVASILGTFFGGLILILLYRVCVQLIVCCSRRKAERDEDANSSLSPVSDYSLTSKGDSVIFSDDDHGKPTCKPLAVQCTQGLTRFKHAIRLSASHFVSYQWPIGRIFIAASMLLSLASFGIYVAEASMWPSEIEKCGHKGRKLRAVDFAFNIFFLLHFLVRFAAAENKLFFWIDWFSILDYCTVPPTIIAFALQRSWMGLRFARIFRLFNLAEVLHNLNVIKSSYGLRLCQLSSLFFAVWLSGAGMVYMLENTGDPFGENPYGNAVELTYTNCLYFTLVTMSTVGYGDITPTTTLARVFVNIFILVALAAFAACIPEIADMLFASSKYSGHYRKSDDRRHVIVCGDVTTESVKHFLDDFLHPDRHRTDVDVVFINRATPDLELRSILHRHFTRVKYFQGTVMNHVDLNRVCMSTADACLILANSRSVDPNQEDAANIMRVVAVKNYASHVRVIVQILQQSNKTHLLNIPTWNWKAGDEIICLSEIKLGFLAQSCLAPGFSTLLTNLFSMQSLHGSASLAKAVLKTKNRSKDTLNSSSAPSHPRRVRLNSVNIAFKRVRSLYRNSIRRTETELRPTSASSTHSASLPGHSIEDMFASEAPTHPKLFGGGGGGGGGYRWLKDYLRGVSMELYSANFSASFEGMTFTQAAVLCMNKLDLMLIALMMKNPPCADCGEEATDYLLINPPASSTLITEGMLGFFICDSQEIASRASLYCSNCHDDVRRLKKMKECNCKHRHWGGLKKGKIRWRLQRTPVTLSGGSETSSQTLANPLVETSPAKFSDSKKKSDDAEEPRDDRRREPTMSLFDITGVYHWTPKRSIEEAILPNNLYIPSTISSEEVQASMQNHVLVCLLAAPSAPLLGLRSFVLPLRASNIDQSNLRPIVFLGDLDFLRREWEEISNFPKVFILPGCPLFRKDLWRARIHLCSVCVILGISDTVRVDDPYMLDKEVILCALNIRALKIPPGMQRFVSNESIVRYSGAEIPVLTALTMDSNIHFLDPEDFATGKSDVHVYLTIPFARGLAFSASVLDALVSTAYFDRNAITLIRHLVTGGTTPVLEKWASCGGEFYDIMDLQDDAFRGLEHDLAKRFSQTLSQNKYKRPQINQMSFQDPQLASILTQNGGSQLTFGRLFCQAITHYGILCLGLFRLSTSARAILTARTGSVRRSQCQGEAHNHSSNASPPHGMSQVQCSSKTNSVLLPSYAASLQVPSAALSKDNERTDSVASRKAAIQPNFLAANSRYVITNPPIDFPVYKTDLVFCLTPHL